MVCGPFRRDFPFGYKMTFQSTYKNYMQTYDLSSEYWTPGCQLSTPSGHW